MGIIGRFLYGDDFLGREGLWLFCRCCFGIWSIWVRSFELLFFVGFYELYFILFFRFVFGEIGFSFNIDRSYFVFYVIGDLLKSVVLRV